MLCNKLRVDEKQYFQETRKELSLLALSSNVKNHRSIEDAFLMPLQYKYVHNLADGCFEKAEGVDHILGYECTKFTLDFYYHILHPDDRSIIFEMTRKCISWANNNLPLRQGEMQLNVLQRIKRANNEYAYIFRQTVITGFVGNKIARTFSLCTDVTAMGMRTMKPAFFYVKGDTKFNHTKVFHQLNEKFICLLTQREIDILYWVLEGYTSLDIALKLSVSKHTVDTHRRNIRRKTGIRSISDLRKNFFEAGL